MKRFFHLLVRLVLILLVWLAGCLPQPSTSLPPRTETTATPPPVLPTRITVISTATQASGTSTLPVPTSTRSALTSTPTAPEATKTVEPSKDNRPGSLFVNPDNRRYFTDGTKINGKYNVIYLTGAHTWCNLIDCGRTNPPPKFDYDKFLDFMKTNRYNFFRLWRAENARGGEGGPDFWFDPMPYERSGECCAFDGKNKFDLQKFSQGYFDRMRERVIAAGKRGIYVSIMLFDGWSVESKFSGHNPWIGHPYKLENNINRINGDVNGNGQGEETHILIGTSVTALQEAYVRKVIDTVNDLDNVLYEISNESPGDNPATARADGSKDWQYHMINLVKQYEAARPKQHPVGMTWEWLNGNNQYLYDSPADWISPGGASNLKSYEPPVADGSAKSKVIIADTDHLCGICGDAQWVWRSFTRGENPIFMDIYDNDTTGRGIPFDNPQEKEIRINLGYTRDYALRMNLVEISPQPALCSTRYCLANPAAKGAEYLVYLPAGEHIAELIKKFGIDKIPNIYLPSDGKVEVDLSATKATLSVEWFNPANGKSTPAKDVQGGSKQTFTAPFVGDAVLFIFDRSQ